MSFPTLLLLLSPPLPRPFAYPGHRFVALLTVVFDSLRPLPLVAAPCSRRVVLFARRGGVADLGLIYEWFYDFSRQLNVSASQ